MSELDKGYIPKETPCPFRDVRAIFRAEACYRHTEDAFKNQFSCAMARAFDMFPEIVSDIKAAIKHEP